MKTNNTLSIINHSRFIKVQNLLNVITLNFKLPALLLFVLFIVKVNIARSSPKMILRLDASGNSMQNETTVYFDSSCTFNYNSSCDALSMGTNPGYLNIVTWFSNINCSIKGLPALTQNISIPIKVISGTTGTYQIKANDIQNLPSGACLILHDNYTNNDHDLRTGAYTCTITDTEKVARFSLNIYTSVLGSISGSIHNPTCARSANGYLVASTGGNGTFNFYWKDSLNNVIKTSLNKNTADTLFNLNAGAYRVDINTSGTCNNGTLNFTLKGTASSQASFSVNSNNILFSHNSGKAVFTNTSKYAGTYWWDFGDGMTCQDTNTTHTYNWVGSFPVTLTAYGSLCNDTSVFTQTINIVQTTGVMPTIINTEEIVISNDAQGYYVKFNLATQENAVIWVTNMMGQTVSRNMEAGIQNEQIRLNLQNVDAGILIIRALTTNNESAVLKIFWK